MDISTEPCPGQLRQHSYAVVRGLFDAATTKRLREICERVLEQWRRAPRCDNPPVGPQANYMRHLNDPEYHRDHPDDRRENTDAFEHVKAPSPWSATSDYNKGHWRIEAPIGRQRDVASHLPAARPCRSTGVRTYPLITPTGRSRATLREMPAPCVTAVTSATFL